MRTLFTAAALAAFAGASAQGPARLTLQQAMDQAAQQRFQVRFSGMEAEKAEAKIKETLAIGLPQIAATGGLNNYIKLPTQVIPNFFGDDPPTIEVQFGIPWSLNGAVQLNQLLFDGSYLVGLKATRALRDKSQLDLDKARHDARSEQVAHRLFRQEAVQDHQQAGRDQHAQYRRTRHHAQPFPRPPTPMTIP